MTASVETAASSATDVETAAASVTEVASSVGVVAAEVKSLNNASVTMVSAGEKKVCSGWRGTVEYDPATEQCCGEGISGAPTVCGADKGCCPGAYTGYPQCFDKTTQKCCGVNSASDMPLVC